MALVVESVSTASATNGDTITITKPTGTTDGDLLLLIATGYLDDNSLASSGFTESINLQVDVVGDTLERQLELKMFYKLAGGSEPANYTITKGGSETLGNSCMLRVSGWSSGDPVFDSASTGGAVDISGGGAQGQSGLTVLRPAGQLLVMAHALNNTDGGTSIFSMASPSITSSDSNPTWTEVIDNSVLVNQSSDSATNYLHVSYAITTDTSDITAYSATLTESTSQNNVGRAMFLSCIVEPTSVTPDISHLAVTPDVDSLTVSQVNVAPSVSHLIATPELKGLETKSTSDQTQWTNTTKNTSAWTNENKS